MSRFWIRNLAFAVIARLSLLSDRSDDILANMDDELFNGLLLVDLKKTFDLVDHDT